MISALEVQVAEEHPGGYVRASQRTSYRSSGFSISGISQILQCLLGAWKALRGDGTEAETEKEKKEPVR